VSTRRHAYPVDEQADVLEVVRAIDPQGETQDIVIYLTDLPRRLGRLPVVVDISVDTQFGMISLPGAGGLFVDRRVRNVAQTIVAGIARLPDKKHRSMRQLTRMQDDDVVCYVAPTTLSRLRLLSGMVYANRPLAIGRGDDVGDRRHDCLAHS
jgi:hypothetical protein